MGLANKNLIKTMFKASQQTVLTSKDLLKMLNTMGLSQKHQKMLENILPNISGKPYQDKSLATPLAKEQLHRLTLHIIDAGCADKFYPENIKVAQVIYQHLIKDQSPEFIKTIFAKSPLLGQTCSELYVAPPVIKAAYKTIEHYSAPVLSTILTHGIARIGYAHAHTKDYITDISPLTHYLSNLSPHSHNEFGAASHVLSHISCECNFAEKTTKQLIQHLVKIPFLLQGKHLPITSIDSLKDLSETIEDNDMKTLTTALLDISEEIKPASPDMMP